MVPITGALCNVYREQRNCVVNHEKSVRKLKCQFWLPLLKPSITTPVAVCPFHIFLSINLSIMYLLCNYYNYNYKHIDVIICIRYVAPYVWLTWKYVFCFVFGDFALWGKKIQIVQFNPSILYRRLTFDLISVLRFCYQESNIWII